MRHELPSLRYFTPYSARTEISLVDEIHLNCRRFAPLVRKKEPIHDSPVQVQEYSLSATREIPES